MQTGPEGIVYIVKALGHAGRSKGHCVYWISFVACRLGPGVKYTLYGLCAMQAGPNVTLKILHCTTVALCRSCRPEVIFYIVGGLCHEAGPKVIECIVCIVRGPCNAASSRNQCVHCTDSMPCILY
jgi:hypothetical protein